MSGALPTKWSRLRTVSGGVENDGVGQHVRSQLVLVKPVASEGDVEGAEVSGEAAFVLTDVDAKEAAAVVAVVGDSIPRIKMKKVGYRRIA